MDEWFDAIRSQQVLAPDAAHALGQHGFVVLPGPIAFDAVPQLQAAYDSAVANAAPADVHVGRASTRVNDFVNRGPEFDAVYAWPPALDAACRLIRRPFRLSAFHARTLRPGAAVEELHVDIPRTSDAWPMLGFILMVDAFTAENGATRFVPGSHRWTGAPMDTLGGGPHTRDVLACGPAGSAILFDASTWHGHTANVSDAPRRSLQATFIPRDGKPATDFGSRMQRETLARIDAVARYVAGVTI